MGISAIAFGGIEQAQTQLQSSATRIAHMGTDGDTVDLSAEAVSMAAAKDVLAANISVLKVADQMQQSVLNLLA